MTTWHAWYSQQQETTFNKSGYTANIYLDKDGKEVKVTEIREVKSPTSLYKDLVYVGEVVRWTRAAGPIISEGEFLQAKKYREDMERLSSLHAPYDQAPYRRESR